MWLPWSASTQHGHVQPVGGRGAGGDDCRVQLRQVSHQPGQGLHHPCPGRGFELLGPARRVCGTNGTWSPQGIPFCGEDEEAFFHLFHVFSVLPYRQSKFQVYIVNLYKISSKEGSTFPAICRYHLWDIILSLKPGEHQNSTCFYVLI